MRLTKKRNGIYDKDNVLSNGMPRLDLKECKLSQLEDIEEELGIDLITLFKALKNGIWCKFDTEKPEHLSPDILALTKYRILIRPRGIELPYKGEVGYGKTWSLTKKELL